MLTEKPHDPFGDFRPVGLQREMSGIEQMGLDGPQIPRVGRGAFRREDESLLPHTINVGG